MALCFGGLRGAVAFALVLSFPSVHRATLVGTTAWVVMITTIVGGAGAPVVLRRLGLAGVPVRASARRLAAVESQANDLDFHVQLDEGYGRENSALMAAAPPVGCGVPAADDAGGAGGAGAGSGEQVELPRGSFASVWRRFELRLLATGSTEAARAAAAIQRRQREKRTAHHSGTAQGASLDPVPVRPRGVVPAAGCLTPAGDEVTLPPPQSGDDHVVAARP